MSKKLRTNNIAKNWEALSGKGEWNGLLDPLDIDLRCYLIHYGERAQSIGDAFIGDTKSKNCGHSRYPLKTFFSDVGLEKGNPFKYEVKRFVHAAYGPGASDKVFRTSEAADTDNFGSNVIGYVAVATDAGKAALGRRDILVVWRGGMLDADWISDFTYGRVSAEDILGGTHNPQVHEGWYTLYTATNTTKYNLTSARDQVFEEVKKQIAKHPNDELSITVAGHSIGAAMTALNAVDMAHNTLNTSSEGGKTFPVTGFAYACPRVGDSGFVRVFSYLQENGGLRLLRVNELLDLVPHLPPFFFGYIDAGQLLRLNILTSPHAKPILRLDAEFLHVHDLELHLHDLGRSRGIVGDSKLLINRCLALVSKCGDVVKDELKLIIEWCVVKMKSMVQSDDRLLGA